MKYQTLLAISAFVRVTAIRMAIGLAIGLPVSLGLLWAFFETGPNCPGKDPSWIGWCSDAPDAR